MIDFFSTFLGVACLSLAVMEYYTHKERERHIKAMKECGDVLKQFMGFIESNAIEVEIVKEMESKNV